MGQGEPEPYTSYQGAYWGLQLHLGGVYRLDAGDGEAPGPAVGVSARFAAADETVLVQFHPQQVALRKRVVRDLERFPDGPTVDFDSQLHLIRPVPSGATRFDAGSEDRNGG